MILDNVRMDDLDRLDPPEFFERVEDWKYVFASAPDAWLRQYTRAFRHGNMLLGIGGVTPGSPRTGELWFMLDKRAYDHPLLIARHFADFVEVGREAVNAVRLAVTLNTQLPVLQKMQRLLGHHGFQHEGTMRRFFEGRDYELWSRIFEDRHVH